jgi:Fe-S-cluster containining protein
VKRTPPTKKSITVADEVLTEVRAVYAELANRPVERACVLRTECCHFKITGRTPYLTKGEALLAARALRAAGRTKLPVPEHGGCPLFDGPTGRCLIYASRPFGCRTHFCRDAGGPYDRRDVVDLIRRLEAAALRLASQQAESLPVAMARVLREFTAK